MGRFKGQGHLRERLSFALAASCLASTALADPLPRPTPVAGSVIAHKAGEEVRFFDAPAWRYVDLNQDLLNGDVLRTNATGQLAILFSDRTQVRLGRNTALLVKRMGPDIDTGLELQSGTIWARAERGGQGLTVDTPAAAAAIRGTDWTLSVGPDGKTSLIVLEGLVELSNSFGSVQVRQGEGAVAAIGSAPSKIIIAQPKDREQMLFNLSLRDAFTWMPATPLIVPEMRRERLRIEGEEAGGRSAADWLSLAEIYLALDGKDKARDALRQARQGGVRGKDAARADLVDALLAGADRQFSEAAKLFERARPLLDRDRAAIAAYGGYFSRSLADPAHVEQPPTVGNGATAAIAKAWAAGFRQDIPAALQVLKAAEAANPHDPTLPAARAQIGILLADEAEVLDGIDKALALDPQDPTALGARASYKFYIRHDRAGALADLKQALLTAPGSSTIWNTMGLVHWDRDANREAEAAFKTAIALDPQDPVGHANLAMLYLDQMRMDEAKREIDAAMAADPSFDIALVARGRYRLQTGEVDKALSDLLAASTANPGYSNAQVLLAAALSEKGDRIPAAQALDNADRLDPNDPIISLVRAAIAIDAYDADAAIFNAQEALRRTRARGGDFAPLGANRSAGSTLNDAFRLQGLDAWGQYYGDVVFDPFAGPGYIDQSVRGSVNPFVATYGYDGNPFVNTGNSDSFSAYMQGLLLEPHMLASRERTVNILHTPFFEAAAGGGFSADRDRHGWSGEAEIQGLTVSPYPISYYGNFEWSEPRDRIANSNAAIDREIDLLSSNAYVTASPTPDDRIVAYVNYAKSDELLDAGQDFGNFPLGRVFKDSFDYRQTTAGLAYSHSFADRNILNAALLYGDRQSHSESTALVSTLSGPSGFVTGEETAQKSYIAAVNHLYGADDLTWRYGVEGGIIESTALQYFNAFDPLLPSSPATASQDFSASSDVARAYIDALYDVTPQLKIEGGLFARYIEDADDGVLLEPRVGIAWEPVTGHWLRAGYLREGENFDTPTLAPIGIVGLQANQAGIGSGGYIDTVALQWDGEWSDRFFTSVNYQHQELHTLTIPIPLSAGLLALSEGRIDRVAVTANLALGNGFGLSLTGAHIDSKNLDSALARTGGAIPFVPEKTGQVALTWVNTANVKATLAANYIGDRVDDTGVRKLDDYWTLDAALQWEPFDKRVEINLSAFNLLDEDFEVRPGIPGWGRSFKGSLKVRF